MSSDIEYNMCNIKTEEMAQVNGGGYKGHSGKISTCLAYSSQP
jgi:hypothetical protein